MYFFIIASPILLAQRKVGFSGMKREKGGKIRQRDG